MKSLVTTARKATTLGLSEPPLQPLLRAGVVVREADGRIWLDQPKARRRQWRIALALGAAVSSMAAQNIGAGLWGRVGSIARYAVAFNFLLTGIPVLVIYLLSSHVIGVFLPPGSPSVSIAEHANYIILWSFPLFGVSMVLSGRMPSSRSRCSPVGAPDPSLIGTGTISSA